MKIIRIVLLPMLVFVLALSFVACNKSGENGKLPESKYEKVKFAFDGVERSFKSSNKKLSANGEAYDAKTFLASADKSALDTIYSVYVYSDKVENGLAELEYDEPPMRQFQFLKAVFEQTGESFVFGEKYYDDVSGVMYFDVDTGRKKTKNDENADEYRYEYAIRFALAVNIDDNDKIFAEVSFDIELKKGETTLNTEWYVSFDLDYDMKSTSPDYVLSMYTDNAEKDLVYLHRPHGYEYDYVEVDGGEIKEWRKFVLDCDSAIVFDETRRSFDDYAVDGFNYNAGTAQWYKNGELKKIKQLTEQKNKTLAKAFVDGVGLNSTAINGEPFVGKQGVKNSAIKDYHDRISAMAGEELVYLLVCDDDDDQGDHGGNGDQGGNGGNGDHGNEGSSWPEREIYNLIGESLPSFNGNCSFMYKEQDSVLFIFVSGAKDSYYDDFEFALIMNSFVGDRGTYYLYRDTTAVIVSVSRENNYIAVTVLPYDPNGGDSGSAGGEDSGGKQDPVDEDCLTQWPTDFVLNDMFGGEMQDFPSFSGAKSYYKIEYGFVYIYGATEKEIVEFKQLLAEKYDAYNRPYDETDYFAKNLGSYYYEFGIQNGGNGTYYLFAGRRDIAPPNVFVFGSFNDWSKTEGRIDIEFEPYYTDMRGMKDSYVVELSFSEGDEFSVTSEDPASSVGFMKQNDELGTYYEIQGNIGSAQVIRVLVSGDYRIVYNGFERFFYIERA